MKSKHTRSNKQAGIALLTTLLLMVLMSAMMVGFMIMVSDGQRLSGMNDDQSRAFYGAESGMEKLTADMGTLFSTTYAPSGAQVNALETQPPVMPASTGITYVDGAGNPAYTISFLPDGKGNPQAAFAQITSGSSPYQGMSALETPYTLQVTARTAAGSEVKLQRVLQTVGLPLFQFGVYSETDLSFFPGPNFNFGGRVHTNGNLFLASGGPANATPVDTGLNQLWLAAPVTVVKDVIRDTLSNGHPLSTGSEHPGSVEITTGGTAYQALGFGQGSLLGGLGPPKAGANPAWPGISASYNGNLRNGVKALPLTIVLVGNGASQPVDTVRRPIQSEDVNAPAVLAERYFSQASLRVLLSDNANDISNLPCVSATPPVNLADLAGPVAGWTSGNATALAALMAANGTTALPIATSGGQAAAGTAGYAPGSAIAPAPGDGYWEPSTKAGKPVPTITGYIKIDAQTTYGTPCGNAVDVTLEVLSLGYAGKNLNPVVQSTDGKTVAANWAYNGLNSGAWTWLPSLPGAQIAPSTCLDPHPNAIIRLERIRDNPSSAPYSQNVGAKGWVPPASNAAQSCGVDPATGKIVAGWTPVGADFWPNALFDPREGGRRDATPPAPFNKRVTLGGTMNYIEVDVNNLSKWFSGAIGKTGTKTLDPTTAPNDFAVYISDRRGNFADAGAITGTWPPTSPSGHETGEYGFSDFVNPASLNACPNGALDTGEDLDSLGSPAGFFTYGEISFPPNLVDSTGNKTASVLYTNSLAATIDDPNCASPIAPGIPWPGTYLVNPNEGRQNPLALFRRAVKLVNGSAINLPACPTGVSCGLTVTTENPMYVYGDYNSNSAGGGFNDPNVPASVAADAVTLLSNNWNDVNSFSSPFSTGGRTGVTTWFRMGVVAGKGASFPIPGWDSTALDGSQDFGTDGGVHNFMRFVENWNSTLNYEGSLVSLFYNRQAVGLYKGGIVYGAPTRAYQFDTNFLNPILLPPRTPMFRDINTTGFTQLLLPNQ